MTPTLSRLSRFALISTAALALAMTGCDSDEGTEGSGGGAAGGTGNAAGGAGGTGGTGGDPATGNTGGGTECDPTAIIAPTPEDEDPSCTSDTDLTGKILVVDGLVVEKPADEFLTSTLNNLFAADIEADLLIILFHVKSHDLETGEALIEAGTGKLEGGNYTWESPPNELTVQITECHFETTEPAQLELTPQTVTKPIVVSGLAVSGQFNADGESIPTANLAGTLRESDADGLDVVLNPDNPDVSAPLKDLLEAASIPLEADTTGDCTNDAWLITGNLTAKVVTNTAL